ncbi:MAG: glycosyltransferase family 39 protein [Bacteroidales bacterium]|nr:glycosyltransferase family 39 protein [Bacteroidales bacterium]
MTKDKIFNWRFCLCCGIFIWFVINLLQGIFTEIQEDEAYYALYGEYLAWGYYDHPPMVGLMTFLSSLFFSGTLGVRFFTIIASCLSLWVMWLIAIGRPFDGLRDLNLSSTVKAKFVEPVETPTCMHVFLFFVLTCSIVMFNIYGFVTTPDASLILFSALFLLVYQRYLENKSWKNALLMGLFMALMIYSKYHAFLFLGLIVLSNLKLLKDGKFWAACLLALALLTPHILWQVNNDFPSFKYHLVGRNEAFRWSYFLEYLPNQLLIFNPFTFGAVVYMLIKDRICVRIPPAPFKRGSGVFERGLKFILIGFFVFFWLMAFRGHVEPHWTIVCVIPVVVLLYRKALVDDKLRKYIKWFILPSLLLVLAFRILLLTPLADRFGYHGKEPYYKAIEQVAGDRPVVIRGSFQQPALYHYFTGKESSTLQCYYDRMTQYDLWQFDKDWIGKSVFVCGALNELSEVYHIGDVAVEGFLTDHFQTANRLITTFSITNANDTETPVFHHGDTIQVDFAIYNPCDEIIDFHDKDFGMCIKAQYLLSNDFSYCVYDDIATLMPQTSYQGHLYTVVGNEVATGPNRFALGIGDRISSFVTEEHQLKIFIEK